MTVPLWFKRTIVPGDTGPDVDAVRRKLGLGPGPYDQITISRVRGLMSKFGYASDGEIDRVAAIHIGETAVNDAGLAPDWYRRPVGLWDEGEDVRAVRGILGLGGEDNRYDPDCEAAVKRFQSSKRIEPTGEIDEETARLLGEAL